MAVKDGRCVVGHILLMLRLVVLKQLDVGTVTLSSLIKLLSFVRSLIICVGSKGIS